MRGAEVGRIAAVVAVLLSAGWCAGQESAVVRRIAFGSCARQDKPQPIWDAINAESPDLFLLTGDNIYADTQDMAVMRAKYEQFAAVEGFRQLRGQSRVLATWDDHDYGVNDGGAEVACRAEAQQLLLDFLGVPQDSPRRTRAGVYHAERFGPPGKCVQVILLDTRYHRSALRKGEWDPPATGTPGPYLPLDEPGATMLGEAQWAWLAEQLAEQAELRVIVSSVQVIANEHRFEKWGNLPRERARLFKLLAERRAGGVLLVSGDRHHAELSCLPADQSGLGYPLYEVTSSGLTQTTRWNNERNAHRLGSIYREANFGLIAIDWDAADPVVRLEVRRADGEPAIVQCVRLSELRPR